MVFVEHPHILPGRLEDRLYQRTISSHALQENLLAVLPTGLGKTAIALRLMAEWHLRHPDRSILFLAPTRPLVEQHARSIRETLRLPDPLVFTGSIPPADRPLLLAPPQVVVATPQVIANDLKEGTLSLEPFSLVIFDEAHRAVGDYPYVEIGRRFREVGDGRVLALTASPGARRDRILEVFRNLNIPSTGLEIRIGDEDDVRPYLQTIRLESVYVDAPEAFLELRRDLQRALDRQLERLRGLGFLRDRPYVTRTDLLELGHRLRAATSSHRALGEATPGQVWEAVNALAVAMKLSHALELAETQGANALREFFRRMAPEGARRPGRADKVFLSDPDVARARERLATLSEEHPKVEAAVGLVRDEFRRNPGARVIVFTQYRDTAEVLVEHLQKDPSGTIHPIRFVGQASRSERDRGLSQKQQGEILDRFRSGEVNCLVATSVAEEGLDIPRTDLVVFYEPVPSEIRSIQRRGRTGRTQLGRAVVLQTRGTRDIYTQRASRSKETRMKDLLEEIQGALLAEDASRGPAPGSQSSRKGVQRTLF